ncbi:MAG: nucleoside deaminase [Clostridiales bacterium]|jgi:tRNA(adenine34) deaminase|nr:nucleoside deaminase [Clostridiales bacterium]
MHNELFMREAIMLAKEAMSEHEVPVGCVIVRNDEIVGRGRNRRERGKNALAHAEISAIDEACKNLGGWRLPDCTLYATLEPCPMCAGAIIQARIEIVCFGAYDEKSGACGSVLNLFEYGFNHKPVVEGGLLRDECAALLSEFFQSLRKGS